MDSLTFTMTDGKLKWETKPFGLGGVGYVFHQAIDEEVGFKAFVYFVKNPGYHKLDMEWTVGGVRMNGEGNFRTAEDAKAAAQAIYDLIVKD